MATCSHSAINFRALSTSDFFVQMRTLVSPATGIGSAWKARFSMIPIRTDGTTKFNTDSKKFKKWTEKTKLVSMNDKSAAWYQKHKESVEEKRVKYWGKWMQKSTEELSERTLNSSDGL